MVPRCRGVRHSQRPQLGQLKITMSVQRLFQNFYIKFLTLSLGIRLQFKVLLIVYINVGTKSYNSKTINDFESQFCSLNHLINTFYKHVIFDWSKLIDQRSAGNEWTQCFVNKEKTNSARGENQGGNIYLALCHFIAVFDFVT